MNNMLLETRPAAAVIDRGERSGTLARGLSILEMLCKASQPATLGEIAAGAGLDQSTTLRLLRTLEEAGYLVRNDTTRRYMASPKLLHPLPLLHPLDQLRREAGPVLKDVAHRLGRTTVLVMFVGWERFVLDVALITGSLTPYYDTWLKGPLHATAGGKSMLMIADAKQRTTLVGNGPYEAVTPRTLTDRAALDAELQLSADRGWIVARDEHVVGVTNVATVFARRSGDAVGCLIATGRTTDLSEPVCLQIGEELARAARLLIYQAPSLEAASRFCGR